ncbi:MAG: adenine nucleotide alpha hydrolase family protein [Desulfovibrio sp.]|nr:adenine nucleotide alpha hydrolase family protein [Desulfovibrio sp.]
MKCKMCGETAAVSLRSCHAGFCEKCYQIYFRRQVKRGIESRNLFSRDDRILAALSGGKDSLALALELVELGYNVTGLFIDLAIPGSSAKARGITEEFCRAHGLPLIVADLGREGLPIPEVKKLLRRPVCSMCGKIKRYYFNKIAVDGGFDCLATGHNLDDEVSRLFSNTLRWDKAYLSDQGPVLEACPGFARKAKPLWRLTEFETANYAFIRNIPCHSDPCPYSGGASFGVLKNVLQKLESGMPGKKLDFYLGFLDRGREAFAKEQESKADALAPCWECGAPTSSGDICGVCRAKRTLAERRA